MKTSKSSMSASVVETVIKETNGEAESFEKARGNLFSVVKQSIEAIGLGEVEIKEYRQGILKQHRSTVYVMITAACNSLLSRHEANLPASYQTLYELHKLSRAIGNDRFTKLVGDGSISAGMSKADVSKLRKSEKSKTLTPDKNDKSTTEQVTEEVVSLKTPQSEPVASSSFDDIKFRFDLLDTETKDQSINYVLALTSKQKEAA